MAVQDFHHEFEFAKSLIPQLSEIILTYFEKEFTISYKDDEQLAASVVTQADKEAEAFLRSSLEKKYPDYGFIGEETPENNKDISWIVDPVDGTLAFSRGLSDFGTALALKKGSEVIFSTLCLPYFNKLYSAYQSEGAFLNDTKIHASNTDSLSRSIISVHQKGLKRERFHDYSLKILDIATVRMSHSSVVEACLLAQGKIDGLIKFEQKIWDLAPQSRLLEEAGVLVTNECGKKINFEFSKDSRQTFVAVTNTLAHDKTLYLPDN